MNDAAAVAAEKLTNAAPTPVGSCRRANAATESTPQRIRGSTMHGTVAETVSSEWPRIDLSISDRQETLISSHETGIQSCVAMRRPKCGSNEKAAGRDDAGGGGRPGVL